MKWWLVVALILPFTQQPTKTPKDKGATKADSAKGISHPQNAKDNQAPSTQPMPPPTHSQVATESQRSAATDNTHTRTNSQQTFEEDRSTQRELTWFTGVLACVGVLQLIVMFLTWLIYRRQAHEMRRQRHEMRRQRHVMLRQWKSMGEQAVLMERQLKGIEKAGEQTSKQLEIAERNVAVMEGQLKEMQSAGKQTAELIAHSNRSTKLEQRAWIQTLNPVMVSANADNPVQGTLIFRNGGRTPALKVKAFCSVVALNSGESVDGVLEKSAYINPIIPSLGSGYVDIPKTDISIHDWNEVLSGKIKYFILGTVNYDDIFNVHHWTNFCYVIEKDGTFRPHEEHNEIDRREENPPSLATSRHPPPLGGAN
jgi:hypothetical protein